MRTQAEKKCIYDFCYLIWSNAAQLLVILHIIYYCKLAKNYFLEEQVTVKFIISSIHTVFKEKKIKTLCKHFAFKFHGLLWINELQLQNNTFDKVIKMKR